MGAQAVGLAPPATVWHRPPLSAFPAYAMASEDWFGVPVGLIGVVVVGTGDDGWRNRDWKPGFDLRCQFRIAICWHACSVKFRVEEHISQCPSHKG